MRTLIKALAITILAFLPATSCMQHNGNIGDFFGTWKLTEMTVGGEADPAYVGNAFFQFQTDVVRIVFVEPHQYTWHSFGSWRRDGESLDLNFSYTAENAGEYDAPKILHLVDGENLMHIDRLTSRRMELTLQTAEGETVRYSLHKQ